MEGLHGWNGSAPPSPDPGRSEAPDVVKVAADEAKLRQRELMAEMRRRTTLDDAQIHELLSPFSTAAYEAGHKKGHADAMKEAQDRLARAGLYKAFALIVSAAVVAWLAVGFL